MTPRSPAPSMRPPAIALLSGFKRAPGRRQIGSLPVQILIHGPHHEAGALAPWPIVHAAAGLVQGTVSDRLGRKRIGCSFLALGIAGALGFFLLARGTAGLF